MASTPQYQITELRPSDLEEWTALFRAYIIFYETSLDDDQYAKTFDRLVKNENDLQGLVVRETTGDGTRLVGFAHCFPVQTTWSEKKILFLDDLFVDPSVRGKSLGRDLIQSVADVGRKTGSLRLQWVTKHTNAQARALYDKLAETLFVEYRMSLE